MDKPGLVLRQGTADVEVMFPLLIIQCCQKFLLLAWSRSEHSFVRFACYQDFVCVDFVTSLVDMVVGYYPAHLV